MMKTTKTLMLKLTANSKPALKKATTKTKETAENLWSNIKKQSATKLEVRKDTKETKEKENMTL